MTAFSNVMVDSSVSSATVSVAESSNHAVPST